MTDPTPAPGSVPGSFPGSAPGSPPAGITGRHPRLFCETLPHPRLADSLTTLDPDESRHARKVLRLAAGAGVELFDGQGTTAQAVVRGYPEGRAVCEVQGIEHVPPPRPRLHLATAIPKGPTAEDMVNQLAQLGVDRLTPLKTRRSVVHPRPNKMQRFARASVTAAKQSGRAYLMRIDPLTTLDAVLEEPGDMNLILTPGGQRPTDLPGRIGQATRVVLVVGPEGGFDPAELTGADAAGFERWWVGPNVLRIQTAAAAASGIVRYLAG